MRMMFVMALAVVSMSNLFASDSTRGTIQGPRLGEHLFSPLAGRPLPFIRTHTVVNAGGGQSSTLRLPAITINDSLVLAPVGTLAVIDLMFRHEQAIKPWMSVYGEFELTTRTGTNVVSLLSQGLNSIVGVEIGWNVRVVETSRWSVVTGLHLHNGSYTTINAERWVRGVVDSSRITPDNALIDTKPVLSGGVSVRPAYSVSSFLGLYGNLAVNLSEPLVRSGSMRVLFDGMAAASADWSSILGVPIGTTLGVEYKQASNVGAPADGSAKNILFRIGYTGEDEFGLGLQTMATFLPIDGIDDEVLFLSAVVDMRFYF
jgi:hypothetical protein